MKILGGFDENTSTFSLFVSRFGRGHAFARETKLGQPKPEAEQTAAPVATQPATIPNDDAVNALPDSLSGLALNSDADSESDSESIVVIAEDPASLQGAVGGASAQPSMEDVLKRLEVAEERAKQAEAKTAALAEQLKQSEGATERPSVFQALYEATTGKDWENASGSNVFKQMDDALKSDNPLGFLLGVTRVQGKPLDKSFNSLLKRL